MTKPNPRHGEHVQLRSGEGEQQGDRVIQARIAVDDDGGGWRREPHCPRIPQAGRALPAYDIRSRSMKSLLQSGPAPRVASASVRRASHA